ncbi:MAG: thiamine diphosphokinase [Anaerolineae bacterium]|nr:thiamine diphosphokinase [Anaerolineae bacterium]
MRVFIVAGSPIAQQPCGYAPGPADRVIAADFGAHHAQAWSWPIDLLIGDLDSLPAAELQAARAAGVPTITAPAAKDETDLELAVIHALGDGATELVICGALGGRTDHMLANLLLLARRELIAVEAVIADGAQTLRVLRGDAGTLGVPTQHAEGACLVLAGAPGDLLTLLPLAGDAEGVSTAGLRYPLAGETLFFAHARGVSNVFDAATACVWLRRGLLLVIHTRIQEG